MVDPRIELSTLTGGGDATKILTALDSVELVVEAPAERTRSREAQVALYNLVSSAARLFPRMELRLDVGVPADLAPFASGDLVDELHALHVDLAPAPTAQPTHRFHLAWGMSPTGDGLAGDASGWSYSVGPEHRPLTRRGGPAVGAVAASSFVRARMASPREIRALAGHNHPSLSNSGIVPTAVKTPPRREAERPTTRNVVAGHRDDDTPAHDRLRRQPRDQVREVENVTKCGCGCRHRSKLIGSRGTRRPPSA